VQEIHLCAVRALNNLKIVSIIIRAVQQRRRIRRGDCVRGDDSGAQIKDGHFIVIENQTEGFPLVHFEFVYGGVLVSGGNWHQVAKPLAPDKWAVRVWVHVDIQIEAIFYFGAGQFSKNKR